MIPANATAAHTSSATVTMTTIRSSSTLTPRCLAVRSPRAKRSRLGATISAMTMPISTRGATSWMFDHNAPFSDPSCQNTICSRVDVVPRNVKNAMPAPAIALIAMPVSSRVTTSVRPPDRLMKYTENTATSPPRNANAGVVHMPNVASPKVMLAAAPSAAPEETPTTPASARGLPKIACMSTPETARAAPTSSPSTMRGIRRLKITP